MAGLDDYNRKRDFKKTREPAGRLEKRGQHRFIVQKHDATRLHYDFRLEMDGVLKSWAVTRGPSPNPEDKRLAVRTEDHPVSYASFEGTIPEGEYGGGTVMLWDQGTWAPIAGKSEKDLEKGHLHFTLDGERMKGEWLLVRIKGRPGEKRENWLLRKIDDDAAGGSDDLVARELTSVKTGRTMAEIAADKKGEASLKGKRGKAFDAIMAETEKHVRTRAKPRVSRAAKAAGNPPAFRKPQLATLVDHVPAGNGWIHEIKFDGYRALIGVAGDKVKIHTRSGLDWTEKFAPIAEAIAALELPPCLIDGEIVSPDDKGNPSFSALQRAIKGEGGGFELFAFDLLSLNGEDLTKLGNVERKAKLAALLPDSDPVIHYADHVVGAGEKLFEAMCKAGQEGIIAKKADAPYRGDRTTSWVKVKCTRRQEFVIIGWSSSDKSSRRFRALLLAQHKDGRLIYAGKVGTGFNQDSMEMLREKFAALAQESAAADVPRSERRGAHWIRPELVAEIAFAEFTHDDVLRHASFLGLRSDKKAAEVKREEPTPVKEIEQAEPVVTISNRDRVIFPEAKATKGDLADYYQAIGPLILPWLARRPVSLVRCPQGRGKQCFFQKHDSGSFGDTVHHVPVREKDGDVEDYLYVEDIAGILSCVQMGTIEFHVWGSRVEDIEKAERLIFDLDPDVGLDFDDVKRAAKDIRTMLADIGLVSFPMLSGGKGIHVIVPLTPEAEWPQVKDFCHRFAEALAQAEPDRFVANMAKAKRVGRIFVDYLRNQRGATAVVPYGVRARENAPVAAPVSWDELDGFDKASAFTIRDVKKLLARASSKALKGWGVAEQRLPDV
ncbi:ATP-dependent DNA ligase [Sphingomonas sp. Root710]|uniref:DNA ligase D n=1 Tax=Sphingomonas sp. Root710 TaxID=1736594 RepID=UPI0006F89DDA|nr:DNA ligase D [Sphingomonas sp. Root710]KRB81382.1 ATP-dependent DNA ligase [Sphingomonas sp. Root710]